MVRKHKPEHQKERGPPEQGPMEPPEPLGHVENAEADPSECGTSHETKDFPIVGLGASAGGLAAIEAFFSAMPADMDTGMAFVLVQHLAPDHKSILTELIRRCTRMQVSEVEDCMTVKQNCVYIIPPNRDMALLNGALQLMEPMAPRGLRLPIDYFFRSLAQDQHERAICIVLSGTGSDGTLGLRAVKGEGGMAMVQDPESTQYDGMPRSAIATGLVDYVLPPAEMPGQLVAYVTHAFSRRPRPVTVPTPRSEDILKKICVLLRAQTSHDFSQYKENTLLRRIERRMALHQIAYPADYIGFLQKNPREIDGLFRDLLIGVTSFFRDPEAFVTLGAKVIPSLFAERSQENPIRIWVCGCSTGEEAYSIAILLAECMDSFKGMVKAQIFATDVDRMAIEQARSGVFPASIAADITAERLARFFTQDPERGTYRVQKHVRDLLVFSEQDVIKDPPFSKIDLLSCRNLLIYLKADLQRRLIPLFHYALNPRGVLFLGTSETVGDFHPLFTPLDRKWKLYRRMEDVTGHMRPALKEFVPPLTKDQGGSGRLKSMEKEERKLNLLALMEQTLLEHYAQTAILINGRGEILQILGRTGKYLEPAPGDPAMNILTMAREGLRRDLATALHKAISRRESMRSQGVRVKTNGDFITADLTIRPVKSGFDKSEYEDMYLVIFEERPSQESVPASHVETPVDPETNSRIMELEQELRAKEEYLQTTLEEMETSNEELKSTNEELQSVNEEMQSTNEELETSKEELQSVNEELATVNVELQNKVVELSRTNNDMNNLLAGTGVGTLFVDMQLRILRFTPSTAPVINLIQPDIGRPLGHVVSNIAGYDRLVEDVQGVLDTLVPEELEVQLKSGGWYLMRIRPYRTLENTIEGAVLTFVDVTEIKRLHGALREKSLRENQVSLAGDILATVREPVLVADKDLRVVMANPAFYARFQCRREETEGKMFYELGNRQWDIPDLHRLLEEILPLNPSVEDFEVTWDDARTRRRAMFLNARRIVNASGDRELILLAFEEIPLDRAGARGAPGGRSKQGKEGDDGTP